MVDGGHTAAFIGKMGYDTRFTHISNGRGACIEFFIGKNLPAIVTLTPVQRETGDDRTGICTLGTEPDSTRGSDTPGQITGFPTS